MSGFGDGYVGTAQDAVKIRRLEKQREAERRKIEELKNKSADGQPGLLQFGSSTSEVVPVKRHLCEAGVQMQVTLAPHSLTSFDLALAPSKLVTLADV